MGFGDFGGEPTGRAVFKVRVGQLQNGKATGKDERIKSESDRVMY